MSILKTAAASKAARFTAVAGLIGATLVGLATVADAATTPSLTLSSATGSATGGDLITVKGKGFMDDAYANQVLGWDFSLAACTTTASTTNQGTGVLNVTSATVASLKTPALAANTWYLCFWDKATGASATILGQAKFVTAAAPTITQVNTVADGGGNAVTASSLGGTLVTIEGANYSKKTLVSIDGVPATKTTVLATGTTSKVTAVLPAHASSATTYALKVSSEYGSVLSTSPVTYQGVVAVSPAVGKASTITSIQLTGIGFNAYNSVGFTDSATANKYLVVFAPGGTTLAAAGAHGGIICTKVLVESDTTLSCKTPVNLSGAYSVQIVVADGTDTTKIAASGVKTVVARNATFTAANV